MISKEQHTFSSASLRPEMNIMFSTKNKRHFTRAAYVYIENYFNESLKKLGRENPWADTVFHAIDENHFMAALYINGTKMSRCKIWFGGGNAFQDGIAYSSGYSFSDSCLGDSLTVGEENGRFYLKSIHESENDKKLTIKLGAEYFWKKFIGTVTNNSN